MGGTPRDEIDRQHTEASYLVDSGMPPSPPVDVGEIPLRWKVRPTGADDPAPRPEEEDDESGGGGGYGRGGAKVAPDPPPMPPRAAEACFSSRGFVDVGPLADLVGEGHDDPPRLSGRAGSGSGSDGASTASTSTDATSGSGGSAGGTGKVGGGKGASGGRGKAKAKAKAKSPSDALYERLRRRPVPSPTNLWCPANAAQTNVHVTRPSHDAWGIKKVCLIFCDDFLRDVYEMPWWHLRPDMRDAVRPILDVLNVPPSRLVRLLLAALPPGVTIPVHHDTGEWVRRTHRVHVPVIVADPGRVLFRCGPTADRMVRIDCAPGHVFELNNRAKHAVSNCSDGHRVHLILDYVDESFQIRRRVRLEPGERLLQTRRSIDRESEAGSRPTPSFMILGAQKAGTTSLYDYLNQHPLVVRARRRETHGLDWRWDDDAITTDRRRERCLGFFYAEELRYHPSCLTGESTPSYLLDSRRVIPRLREVYDHPIKFFVVLRDPVKRAYSHYRMVTSLDGTPEQIKNRGTEWLELTFEEVVRKDFANMKEDGLIPYWDEGTRTVDVEAFDKFAGSEEEDEAWDRYLRRVPLGTGSHSPVSRGMYELNLRPWMRSFPPDRFLVLRLEDMASEGGVRRAVDRALDHLDLPRCEVRDESVKNARAYDPMEGGTGDMLRRFYEPHNRRLGKVLGEDWADPWPYE